MHRKLTAPRDRLLQRFRHWMAVAALAILLIAGWAANWQANAEDSELRAGLLEQAVALARTIDPAQVKSLAFTEADKNNPVFVQLREQLVAYEPLVHCRGIYTLAARNGELAFGPESYAETDPQASPAGTIYKQPTAQIRAIFKTGQAFTEGLYTDEYGTFLSAFAPVFDPRNGEVLMVVGVDIEASDLQATTTRVRLIAGLWALVLATILLGGALVLSQRDRRPASPRDRMQYFEVYFIATLGATLTCCVAVALHTEETRARRGLFLQLAETQAERVGELFRNLRDDQVGALARFYRGSQQVERDEFRTFTQEILQNGAIQAFAWIPSIPAAQMETLETQARADGFEGFTVWQSGAGGRREPVAGREIYYPVCYVEPLAGNEAALGYDLGSEPQRAEALKKAIKIGLTTATAPVTMVQSKQDQIGILIFHPIFSNVGTAKTLRGFALAVVRLELLLQTALGSWQADGDASSYVDLFQLTSGQDPCLLASSSRPEAPLKVHGAKGNELAHAAHAGISGVYPLFMFGKSYALIVHPGPAFLAERPARAGWISAAVGLLLTALLMVLMAFLTRRRADLETQVRERTAQLQDSEKRTRAITDSAQDAIVMLDPEGRISFWNPGAERVFGYAREEALGQDLHMLLMPPRYLEAQQAGFSAFRQTGQGAAVGHIVDLHARRKDGQEISIQLSLSTVQIDGRWHGVGIVRDVTEQQRNEAQLRKMSRVVEQTPAAVVITDLAGNIEYVNPAFTQATGYTFEEALGQNPRILKSGRQPPEIYAKLWRELSAGREWKGELQNRRKNGDLYWEFALISPLKDATGNITHYLAVKDNISDRKTMEDELRSAAQIDKLTGLPNRALLGDRLQQAVLRAKRHRDYHFAVLFLDFDRFKLINDSLGHDVGDLLLKEIALRLQSLVRWGDSINRQDREHTAARLGGDEFVVLLDSITSPQDAAVVADRMIEAFAQPYHLGEHTVHSTASIGIVTSDMPAESAADVLRDADTAMYEAKLAGKGRYVVFDVSMRQRVQNSLNLESDLRHALEGGQLFLMYQPIVSLQTSAIESFEALLRWKHPERGLIPPGEFIPVAEETGLILPISEWVLREACGQFAQWQEVLGDAAPRSISVNLSRKQLAQHDLPQRIVRILEQVGMTPDCLHLEITESAVMKDPAAAVQMLHAIKAIGVKLDMDDFGTGYSSLACLHQFPIDVLKIDRSFVANIDRGQDFAALVHAVAHLAHNLKISVVAEGIETVEQLMMLQSLECPFGQGYLFSKPMMADQVAGFRVPPVGLPGQVTEALVAVADPI